ncbi:hypothetical protein [Parapedobacter sp. 10938]|uniref:hypothetical protein n=1 Tax=Parapedobacter flavus TaxID=3110225 RepID=UPI002DBD8A18|nr:hypothetical protein [Parapedobacter sp. 10938]MEC3879765.1 hypothetical protein [Parapedobacter sp. 10938]
MITPFIPEKEDILAVYLFAIATILDLDLSEDPHSRTEFFNLPIMMNRRYTEKACEILEIDHEEFYEFLEYVTYAGIERLDQKVHDLSPFYTIFFRQ